MPVQEAQSREPAGKEDAERRGRRRGRGRGRRGRGQKRGESRSGEPSGAQAAERGAEPAEERAAQEPNEDVAPASREGEAAPPRDWPRLMESAEHRTREGDE